MDVGFNNRNLLGLVDPALADVVFLVECDGNSDQFNLWQDWAEGSMSNIDPLPDGTIDILKPYLTDNDVLFKTIKRLNEKVKKNHHTRVKWEEVSSGFGLTIGHVGTGENKLPVCVSFSFAYIKDTVGNVIHKVDVFNAVANHDHNILGVLVNSHNRELFIPYTECLPATEQDYLTYKDK